MTSLINDELYSELTIVIPSYNEELAIVKVLEDLKSNIPNDVEIIVIDDASTDNTYSYAKSVKGVKVVRHYKNIGYGGAIKTGIKKSDRKFIAWYDSDGQHNANDLLKVVAPVLNDEQDAVIGSRDKSSYQVSSRVKGKKILAVVAGFVAGKKIPDFNSGLRCFKRDVIKKYVHLFPDGFSASTTSTLLLIKRGYRVAFVDISVKERLGDSSVNNVKDGYRALRLIFRILVLFHAFELFLVLSLVQLIPACIYGVYKLIDVYQYPVIAGTLFLSGIVTFFFGVVTDQIVSMRKEKFEFMD